MNRTVKYEDSIMRNILTIMSPNVNIMLQKGEMLHCEI